MLITTARHFRHVDWFRNASKLSYINSYNVQRLLKNLQTRRNVTSTRMSPSVNGTIGAGHALQKYFVYTARFGINIHRETVSSILRSSIHSLSHYQNFVNGCSTALFCNRKRGKHVYRSKKYIDEQLQLVCLTVHQQLNYSTSTGNGAYDKNDSKLSVETKLTPENVPSSTSTQDPLISDFAQYLADAETEEKRSASAATRRRNRSSAVMFGLEKEREMVEHVRKVSYNQKEQNRVRTLKKVNRSLMGNLVICAGTLFDFRHCMTKK
jgi:hypothetical protein